MSPRSCQERFVLIIEGDRVERAALGWLRRCHLRRGAAALLLRAGLITRGGVCPEVGWNRARARPSAAHARRSAERLRFHWTCLLHTGGGSIATGDTDTPFPIHRPSVYNRSRSWYASPPRRRRRPPAARLRIGALGLARSRAARSTPAPRRAAPRGLAGRRPRAGRRGPAASLTIRSPTAGWTCCAEVCSRTSRSTSRPRASSSAGHRARAPPRLSSGTAGSRRVPRGLAQHQGRAHRHAA